MSDTAILSRAISVTELPSGPVEIVAREAERKALAAAYDLIAVKSLTATVTATAAPAGGVDVEGRVVADIVQTCVVSLVPVEAHIDETFTVTFVRDASRLPRPGTEIVVEPDAADPPELIEGPTIDIGALAEEYFALAIDPYPRAPGATLPPEFAGDDEPEKESPFAVLARLAKPTGGKG